MHIETISAEPRQPGGKHANERLRRRGMIPAVIYGHNRPPETVAVSQHDLLLALQHTTHVVNLEMNGSQTQYLLKDIQYDHLHHVPIHVDLMRVAPDERVHVKLAIELRGEPHGVHEGGELLQVLNEIEIECPLLEVPDTLKIKVDHLGVNQALHVGDLELPEGVKALHKAEDVIAVVRPKKGVAVSEAGEEEAVEEAPAEPEVMGRGKKEEDEQ